MAAARSCCWRRKVPANRHFSSPAGSVRELRRTGGRLRQSRQRKMPICRMFSTGATGLEPATSGVTGRVGHNDAQRRTCLNGFICRHFSRSRCRGSAWLSQSSNRRLGHEWATRLCLGRQPSAVNHRLHARPLDRRPKSAAISCDRSAVCLQPSALWSSCLQV